MAIIVVGDINVDEIEKKIKDNFSKYKTLQNQEKENLLIFRIIKKLW